MAVTLGEKPLADFTEPIEMMKDCHRRIEHFLGVLRKVVAQFGAGQLTEEARRALETSLNYFANSAPRHTADEERSLFPRMRATETAEGREVMEELGRLEQDHRRGEAAHALVDRLVRQWLATGRIDEAKRKNLQQALDELASMYETHIRLEEQRVFALASHMLNAGQIREIGEEMKRRRSLRNGISEANGA
ncbi:MAG TPA: hemerythrin domain-containing protein [Lacipirellulaceae bacterium]|nr:hemerythrin domain-containing protein [Lacipirellulaceae bacterium]